MASRIVKIKQLLIIRHYLAENSCKCIKTILKVFRIKMVNQKLQNLQKRSCLSGNIQLICGKKVCINFWCKMPPFLRKMVKCATKRVFHDFLRKYCRIKKYSALQNIALLMHFLCQRFFDVVLRFIEETSERKLSHLEL